MIVNIQISITLEYGEKKSRSKLALRLKFNLARNIITTVKFVHCLYDIDYHVPYQQVPTTRIN